MTSRLRGVRTNCLHPSNSASADRVGNKSGSGSPILQRESLAHLKAVRVRFCSLSSKSRNSCVWDRLEEGEQKNKKGKLNPLMTLIWILTLVWGGEAMCGVLQRTTCWLRLLHYSGLRSVAVRPRKLIRESGRKRKKKTPKDDGRLCLTVSSIHIVLKPEATFFFFIPLAIFKWTILLTFRGIERS